MGLFDKIKKGLAKTRESVGGHIGSVIRSFSSNRDEMLDELEETQRGSGGFGSTGAY